MTIDPVYMHHVFLLQLAIQLRKKVSFSEIKQLTTLMQGN